MIDAILDKFAGKRISTIIQLTILVISVFLMCQSMWIHGDVMTIMHDEKLQSSMIHGIGATVREPLCVEFDRLHAIQEMKDPLDPVPSWTEVTEYLQTNDKHYSNGLMSRPNWIPASWNFG